jgi:hypothetical protein
LNGDIIVPVLDIRCLLSLFMIFIFVC